MRNFLGVDIGNSGIRISRMDLDTRDLDEPLRIDWLPSGTSPTSRGGWQRFDPASADWLPVVQSYLERLPASQGQAAAACRWLVASVRSDALQVLRQFVRGRTADHWHAIGHRDVPLATRVDFPDRLGIDRLLAALAATRLTATRPLVVIQAGSAVTVDLVTQAADGQDAFEGGAILPGVPMMLRLLGRAADMLPELEADDLTDLPAIPGRNTEAAMTCGAASALVGGVQHLVSRYRQAYAPDLTVILSGGDGMRLSPYISPPVMIQPHLVHQGLLQLARQPQNLADNHES